jgi:hypothetical protein
MPHHDHDADLTTYIVGPSSDDDIDLGDIDLGVPMSIPHRTTFCQIKVEPSCPIACCYKDQPLARKVPDSYGRVDSVQIGPGLMESRTGP